MAKRRPTSTNLPDLKDTTDDAFTSGLYNLLDWTRSNVQAVTIGAAVIVVLIVGGLYALKQRSANLDLAAAEFVTVQNVFATAEAAQAVVEIQAYIDRFPGTTYAEEAHILLGQIHLEEGEAAEAIATLEEIAPEYGSTTGIQATLLLGVAFEEADQWSDAAGIYQAVIDQGEFAYQREEAAENLVRVHLASGDTAAAVTTLEGLLEAMDADDVRRAAVEMRVAELEAALP